MNPFGILIGISAFLLIGIGFPWVIYLERYGGYQWAPVVCGIGILLLISSLFMPDEMTSSLVGIFGGTLIWGAGELKEQSLRCQLGWFKNNVHKWLPPWAR